MGDCEFVGDCDFVKDCGVLILVTGLEVGASELQIVIRFPIELASELVRVAKQELHAHPDAAIVGQ